ncbi:MAG TPA: DUF4007 family protein [Acidobacteriota bacterium]|jgi:hypothetical protein
MKPKLTQGLKSNDSHPLPKFSFSGHETFVFRHGWLKKAYDGIQEDQRIFTRDEALIVLGVGKNMVRSIRHWALATCILEEEPGTRGMSLQPTKFGEFLFGKHDPYLEDLASLWLLHWKISTNLLRCTTWAWALNMPTTKFTRESLLAHFQEVLASRTDGRISEHTLRRDIDCFLRTYVSSKVQHSTILEDSLDCPLVELRLIVERSPGDFEFRRGQQDGLPFAIFLYALLDFWERTASGRESLAFSEIAYTTNSPGIIFKLDENSLTLYLEQVEETSAGALLYTETAGIQQVYRRHAIDGVGLLSRYYEHSNPIVQGV